MLYSMSATIFFIHERRKKHVLKWVSFHFVILKQKYMAFSKVKDNIKQLKKYRSEEITFMICICLWPEITIKQLSLHGGKEF